MPSARSINTWRFFKKYYFEVYSQSLKCCVNNTPNPLWKSIRSDTNRYGVNPAKSLTVMNSDSTLNTG